MNKEKQMTIFELVDNVMPCIKAKQYSESYIYGFRQIFSRLKSYCEERGEKYFTTDLSQQFLSECYGVQPGTVERRCSRIHRAMDLLSDYQHFGTVMIRWANETTDAALPEITPHCLRHSKAMHLVEVEKNLIYIRDFLGHESIETTQIYAKANPEARRKALETMDKKIGTPNMPDWNDDPDLKAFLKGL